MNQVESLIFVYLFKAHNLNEYRQKIRTRWVKVSFHSVLLNHFFYYAEIEMEQNIHLQMKIFIWILKPSTMFISEL